MSRDRFMESIKSFLDVLLEIVCMMLEIVVELCVLRVNTGKEIVHVRLEFTETFSLRFCEAANRCFEGSKFSFQILLEHRLLETGKGIVRSVLEIFMNSVVFCLSTSEKLLRIVLDLIHPIALGIHKLRDFIFKYVHLVSQEVPEILNSNGMACYFSQDGTP